MPDKNFQCYMGTTHKVKDTLCTCWLNLWIVFTTVLFYSSTLLSDLEQFFQLCERY